MQAGTPYKIHYSPGFGFDFAQRAFAALRALALPWWWEFSYFIKSRCWRADRGSRHFERYQV